MKGIIKTASKCLLLAGMLAGVLSPAVAESFRDFNLANDEQMKIFKESGVNASLIYLHKDWGTKDGAPVIQLELFDEDGKVGDYSALKNILDGKSKLHQLIIMDEIMRTITGSNNRVIDFEFLEEINAFKISLAYYENTSDAVWHQDQVWYWSQEKKADRKCVIASDVTETLAPEYEKAILDSLVSLRHVCTKLFNYYKTDA